MGNELTDRIESKIDRTVVGGVQLRRTGGGLAIMPQNVAEALELAKVLSTARGMIPAHLEGNPGACADVVFQALQWGMNPFALAKQSYVVQRGAPPAYMSQALIAAVNANANLKERLRYTYQGEGGKRRCTVSGVFVGSDDAHEYTTPEIDKITPKNSPLWKTDPDRQLGYWAARAWARLYASDILMGVYADDEIDPASTVAAQAHDPFAGEGPRVPAISDRGASADSASPVAAVDSADVADQGGGHSPIANQIARAAAPINQVANVTPYPRAADSLAAAPTAGASPSSSADAPAFSSETDQ